MRKSLALAAVLTATALSLAAAPASASPGNAPPVHPSAITPDTAFTDVQICETGDGLCMAGHDGNGGGITGEPFATGVAETVNIIGANDCGGTVVYEPNAKPQPVFCPFADHAQDNQYKGDDLVVIQNADNLMTYRSFDASGIFESPGSDGEVWVQDGNLAGSGPAADLINVKVSATEASQGAEDPSEAACGGGGAGRDLFLANPGNSGGLCAWKVHS
jgi:hypothetical protein